MSLDTVLSALADPVRRTIVAQLAHGHDDQACIAFSLPVSKSTSTHHFRVLREAGVISQQYRGTSILERPPHAKTSTFASQACLSAVLAAAN